MSEPERGAEFEKCAASVSVLRLGSDEREDFSIEAYFKFMVTAVNARVSEDVSY